MRRKLNEIVPLTQCVFVIGNTTIFIRFFKTISLQTFNYIFFNISAESGSGKSTFIKLLIKNLNQGGLKRKEKKI
jgi:ABC-type dipeptide/oligopeptide/nickel transport system ATPase subunit